jgi:PhnB protein
MSKKDKAKGKKSKAKEAKAKKKPKAKAVPIGFHTATPYLFVQGAANAIDFYKSAFKAKEVMRMPAPGGRVRHAQIKIGDSNIMISDESPDMGAVGPKSLGGSPVMLYLYVKDVDAVMAQAVAAGAKIVHPVKDQYYGDRSGGLEDPFGHLWHVATHKEDVPLKELRKRAETAMAGQGQK